MRFLLLFSRQGKLRLQKWFTPMSDREKKKIIREMTSMVLSRQPRSCNFLHWKDLKIIYKRWALPAHVVFLDFVFVCNKTQATAETAFYATIYHVYVNLFCHLFSRYASLYFCLAIENQENELLALEVIHRYVELLDKYFGNVHNTLRLPLNSRRCQ